ncbi:hypothetical protein CR513_09243, partial [Mucuna pruriens]
MVNHHRLSMAIVVEGGTMEFTPLMIKKGFRVGQGLGKNLHGISKSIELKGNPRRNGLGY